MGSAASWAADHNVKEVLEDVGKIRLRRVGAKRSPFYRLVVADARSPRDGRFIEQVGYYNPLTEPATVKIDEEKVVHWLSQGAQPSESARTLLKREGVLERYAASRKSGSTAVQA